jgi:hypothetical protein
MTRLSPQSEAYLRSFRNWLHLFPRGFREQFSEEITKVLRDQLAHAERASDPSMLREVYLTALADLPRQAFYERMHRRIYYPTGWLGFNVGYILLAIASGYGFETGNVGMQVIPILSALCIILLATWRYTGRISLAILTTLLGLGGFIMAVTTQDSSWILNSPLLSILNGNIFPISVALLLPYAALLWFMLHPRRYARISPHTLDDKALAVLSLDNTRKRHIAWRVAGVVGLISIIPNFISLFTDPKIDLSTIQPPVHYVAPEQNAYFPSAAIGLPTDVWQDNLDADPTNEVSSNMLIELQGYITGSTPWNQVRINYLLQDTSRARVQFIAAASLPAYQDPERMYPERIQNVQDLPVLGLDPYEILTRLTLLEALNLSRQHQTDSAVSMALNSLHFSEIKDASNQDLLGHLVSLSGEEEALAALKQMNLHSLPAEEQEKILAALPSNLTIWNNAKRSLRWEADAEISSLSQPDPDGVPSIPLIPPYMYRPNLTEQKIALSFSTLLATPTGTCLAVQTPSIGLLGIFRPSDFITYNGLGNRVASFGSSDYSFIQDCTLSTAIKKFKVEL